MIRQMMKKPLLFLCAFMLAATGALAAYISDGAVTEFQPMNVNFGIIDGSGIRAKGKAARLEAIADRALRIVAESEFAR
mgnify:CR=1 FL=1